MSSILKVSEIQDPTNGNTALSIDSSGNVDLSGRLTTPGRPFFYARPSTALDDSTTNPIPYGNAIKNIGGHYDASTSKFTCPVDGVYFFAGQVYKENTHGNIKLRLTRGGADTNVAEVARMLGAAPTEHSALSFAITYYFLANDVVFMYRDVGTYHQNTSLSYFTGCLIG